MSRKRPAIMERPHYRFICRRKIIKENFYIKIITVNIMQMNNIRVIFFYFFNKPFGHFFAAEARRIKKPRFKCMQLNVCVRAYSVGYILIFFRDGFSAVCNFTFMTFFHKCIGKVGAYSPCAAYATDRIYH